MTVLSAAIVGLASSHPERLAILLSRRGVRIATVWDQDRERAAALAQRCDSTSITDWHDTPLAVDVIILGDALDEKIDHIVHFTSAGVPVYICKPAVGTPGAADRLLTSLAPEAPAFSLSPLYFAPAVTHLADETARLGDVSGASLVLEHNGHGYLSGRGAWQSDASRGGGSLVHTGLHGLDMLQRILGQAPRPHAVVSSSSKKPEEFATLASCGAIAITTLILTRSNREQYRLALFGSSDCAEAVLSLYTDTNVNRTFGYDGLTQAIIDLARGDRPPVPLLDTLESLAVWTRMTGP